MNCPSNTNVSEFLAGISLLCLVAHASIVYFMRPMDLNVRFNPVWNTLRPKSPPVLAENVDTDSTEEKPDGDVNNKSFYSYFT